MQFSNIANFTFYAQVERLMWLFIYIYNIRESNCTVKWLKKGGISDNRKSVLSNVFNSKEKKIQIYFFRTFARAMLVRKFSLKKTLRVIEIVASRLRRTSFSEHHHKRFPDFSICAIIAERRTDLISFL